jgi:predicted metal-dependent phosphoesterase TrpH
MPRGSPFTELCRFTANSNRVIVADLHTHSTASDGAYTPSQVVAHAVRERLQFLALTDHDTFAGHTEADQTLEQFTSSHLRLIPGVELSCTRNDREVHLLAYFPNGTTAEMQSICAEMTEHRRLRFVDGVQKLRDGGHTVPEEHVEFFLKSTPSLGRRHLSQLVRRAGLATDGRSAWTSILGPIFPRIREKKLLPLADAIALVQLNGGFCSMAHPSPEVTRDDLISWKVMNLDAVEVSFPAAKLGRSIELRAWAKELGLLMTGGSDFHAPVGNRHVGDHGLTSDEVAALPVLRSGEAVSSDRPSASMPTLPVSPVSARQA